MEFATLSGIAPAFCATGTVLGVEHPEGARTAAIIDAGASDQPTFVAMSNDATTLPILLIPRKPTIGN